MRLIGPIKAQKIQKSVAIRIFLLSASKLKN